MKKYESPMLEITKIEAKDIITTSPGTTGPTVDEESNAWGVGIGFGI